MCRKIEANGVAHLPQVGVCCALPGTSEENPPFQASASPAGNSGGVGAAGIRVRCSACRVVFLQPDAFRPQHECPSCNSRKERARPACSLTNQCLRKCIDCGEKFERQNKRGPTRIRCLDCTPKAKKRRITFVKDCSHCGRTFDTHHRKQLHCSPLCGHTASRKRVLLSCEACGKQVELTTGVAEKRRYCSPECCQKGKRIWRTCVGCGKEFNRRICGSMPHQDKGKYCTKQCYFDHRFGKDRPRKQWSTTTKDRASRRALHVSLKQRCKHYGVPFDPACTRKAVCERDGWKCQDCGVQCHKGGHRFNKKTRKTSLRNAEHDHIVPLAWGVPTKGNTFDNSQCLCRKCNLKKGSRRAGQMIFPEMATP